ncbi:Dcm Site-specific DNA methylase [Burkholderiaceae bacterium]
MMKKFTSIDLFAGVGGLSLGLKNAGFEILFANEFDLEAGTSFQKNFPDANVVIDDIRKIDLKKLSSQFSVKKDVDLIVGGPPCQGFSMANRKRIENDERNLLFLEFVRFVNFFQPKCFLIENVLGMKSENVNQDSNESKVMESMREYFHDLGYAISFKTFKSEEHGVPQIRRRVIVIGTRLESKKQQLLSGELGNLEKICYSKDELSQQNNDIIQNSLFDFETKFLSPPTVWCALSDLPRLEAGESAYEYLCAPQNEYQKIMREGKGLLLNHSATPHSSDVVKRIKLIQPGQNFQSLPEELKTKSHHSGAWGRLEKNSLCPTITTRFDTPSTGRVIHPIDNRTLSVREAARIQSFPDSFKFEGSRSSQGKQVGNSVPPLVAQSIGKMFIRDFLT